jgi:acyl-CoA reductase-like NAD-dependent aldehyde dehydrogenase
VSAISAYNYPTQLNLAKLGPALAGGCTVVLKGARHTPLITLALGRLIAERTDIPPGVVNVLASSAVEPGVVMTTDPDVDMVTFTGSTAVGRSIMAAASETLKKTFLELGGKSALVVAVAKRIRTGTVSVNGGMVARARRAGRRLQAVRDRPRERHGGARGVPADEAARPPGKGLSTTVPEPMTSTLDPGGAWSWS